VPTIAVATGGGVSVIKDDGTVISTVSDTGYKVHNIDLQANGNLFAVLSNSSNANYSVAWAENYTGISGLSWSTYTNWNSIGGFYYANVYGSNLTYIGGNTGGTINDLSANAIGSFYGLTKTDKNPSDFDAGLVNFISSSYNTGWMNGDIKLATLSDTDDTDVTGSELVTNGTFDTDVSGWSGYSGGSITWSSGSAVIAGNGSNFNGGAQQTISGLVSGETYVLTITKSSGFNLKVDLPQGSYQTSSGTGTFVYTWVADGGDSTLLVQCNASTVGATVTVDDISIRKAEEDRSVNGNGLQVFGTVTKNPVATGADLVAYSGWSGSNYLSQPYNSDLDLGTTDFCVMTWVKRGAPPSYAGIISYGNGDNTTNKGWLVRVSTSYRVEFRSDVTGGGSLIAPSGNALESTWTHVCFVRSGSTLSLYQNGKFVNSTTGYTADLEAGTSATLDIGTNVANDSLNVTTNSFVGSLALTRISATAPSPEQIAKIYEDEKVLFQENAQATLYGDSDAVTALAYDDSTELLHVGTSAGRSVFQGLRRVDNTTTAVGAAISASNGLVADE
jgi:roadblock/LC7 domain-containing protein